MRAALDAGAVGYLSKDMEPEHLAVALELAAAGIVLLSSTAFAAVSGAREDSGELSVQESRLLKLAAAGAPVAEIAQELSVSRATATRLFAQLQRKVGVSNRDQLVATAARRGWV